MTVAVINIMPRKQLVEKDIYLAHTSSCSLPKKEIKAGTQADTEAGPTELCFLTYLP